MESFHPSPKTSSQSQQDGPAAFGALPPGRYDYPPPPVPPGDTLAGTTSTIPGASILAATLHNHPHHFYPHSSTAAGPRVVAPATAQGHVDRPIPQGVGAARSAVEAGLRELRALQLERRRGGPNADVRGDERLRAQAADVLDDLRALREEVAYVVRGAESHRWRRWLFGGILASLIPAVRAIWRRPSSDVESSNDTEYAFKRSKSLISRILKSAHGLEKLASFTFFIFAVVYVFQNEVSLRVAKTVSRKLKQLSVKMERGEEGITEKDVKLLRGWRWRVLVLKQ